MALATSCVGFVLHRNGLIVRGLTSTLMPVRGVPKDGLNDAIHRLFAGKTKLGHGKIARISQVLRRKKTLGWYQELPPEFLVN